jgi:hypothetical protein
MLALDGGRLPDHCHRVETGNASSDGGHGHTLVEVTNRAEPGGNEAYGRIVHAVRGDVTGRGQPARSALKSRQDNRRR